MTKEELKSKIEILEEEVDKIWDESFKRYDGYDWYRNHPKTRELIELDREYRLVKDYNLYPIDDCGNLIPIKEFVEDCKHGFFSDYDGSGVYATAQEQSTIDIKPSDILANKYRKDFTHVMWYNK